MHYLPLFAPLCIIGFISRSVFIYVTLCSIVLGKKISESFLLHPPRPQTFKPCFVSLFALLILLLPFHLETYRRTYYINMSCWLQTLEEEKRIPDWIFHNSRVSIFWSLKNRRSTYFNNLKLWEIRPCCCMHYAGKKGRVSWRNADSHFPPPRRALLFFFCFFFQISLQKTSIELSHFIFLWTCLRCGKLV